MVVAVPPAVIALQLVERSRDAPVLPFPEPLIGERVDRALLPREWRIARGWPARRNVRRPGRQRVAVVEVLAEVAAGLHAVDDCDDVPGQSDRARDLLVARPVRRQPARYPVDHRLSGRSDQARLVEQGVLAAQ